MNYFLDKSYARALRGQRQFAIQIWKEVSVQNEIDESIAELMFEEVKGPTSSAEWQQSRDTASCGLGAHVAANGWSW